VALGIEGVGVVTALGRHPGALWIEVTEQERFTIPWNRVPKKEIPANYDYTTRRVLSMRKIFVILLFCLGWTIPGRAEKSHDVRMSQEVDSASHSMVYQPAKPAWEASSRIHGALMGMTHVWQVYPVAVQSLDKKQKHLALVVIVKSQGKQVEHASAVTVLVDGVAVPAQKAEWAANGLAYLWMTTSTAMIADESLIRKMAAAKDVRVTVTQEDSQLSVKLSGKQLEQAKAVVEMYDGMEPTAAVGHGGQ
jgi:hypothetical protein